MSVLNINIEELLKELDPATLQALEQSLAEDAPAVRKIIHNILDEPISEKVEKSLDKPLIPETFQPTAPPRKRRGRKTQEILRKFDPISRENIRNVTNYQNEILDLYDNTEYEGEEVMRRSIRKFNIPPRATPRAFELLKIGLFKYPPLGAKKPFKCPTN